MPNERLFVKSSFTPQLRGVNLVPPATPKIVSWSEGTDAEIAAMLDAHYAGTINLHEIWNIGDTRTVHLSAMPATGVGESHIEQDVDFQIVNAGGKELADGTDCAFIVQLRDVLYDRNRVKAESGYMNPTKSDVGGWKDCARRAWCNNVFRNALPESTKNLFKLHKNKTAKGSKSAALDITEDYFALPCLYNILKQERYNVPGEDTVRWAYCETQSGRQKAAYELIVSWWTRSPCSEVENQFLRIAENGNTYYMTNPDSSYGIAPFGTI